MNHKLTITLVEDDGEEIDHQLPAKWVVCSRCNGAGRHVNPSIDGNGLTREDFDADPDFEEAYFSGAYDVTCYACEGRTTVEQVDFDRLTFADRRVLVRHRRSQREIARDSYAERYVRMMEGGWA